MKPTESPRSIGRWRSSTRDTSPSTAFSGSGTESTTRSDPPAASGRRIAIRGSSVPAIRFALTLAETSTPASGASTVAWRSANWRNP